jgi:hypothetical protein
MNHWMSYLQFGIFKHTTINLLAERAEETPYTHIINFIDPVFAKHGYFSALETDLDVKKVLQKHLGEDFVLVPSTIGGATGELWWLKKPSKLSAIFLSLRELMSKGKVAFTQVWNALSTRFPNLRLLLTCH